MLDKNVLIIIHHSAKINSDKSCEIYSFLNFKRVTESIFFFHRMYLRLTEFAKKNDIIIVERFDI